MVLITGAAVVIVTIISVTNSKSANAAATQVATIHVRSPLTATGRDHACPDESLTYFCEVNCQYIQWTFNSYYRTTFFYDDSVNTVETVSGQYGVRAILTGNDPLPTTPTVDFRHLTSSLTIETSNSLSGYLHNISCSSNAEVHAQQLKIAEIPNMPRNVQVSRVPLSSLYSVRWDAPDNSERFDIEYFKIYIILLSEQESSYIANGTSTELEYRFSSDIFPPQSNLHIIVTAVSKCSQEGLRSQALELRDDISRVVTTKVPDTVQMEDISTDYDYGVINGYKKPITAVHKALMAEKMAAKRKLWTTESMEAAYEAVINGKGLREASRMHNVPVETLRRRVNGSVAVGCKPGPATILSDEEEDLLCEYIINIADMGYGLTREDVQRLACKIAEKTGRKHPFKDGKAGRGWFDGFKARHPNLSFRTPQSLSFARALSANEYVVADFFAKLGSIYGRLNLITKPMQVYNADETGVSVVHKMGKVLAHLGRRHVYSVASGEKGKTHTILTCVSASGMVLPPMMVYPRKNKVPDNVREGCVPNTLFVHSDSGWINADLFIEWFKFFINNIPPTRPVVLIQDGHSSHVSIELVELARENNIHLLCLPSHTSHILQPLDVGCFKSFKANFSKACHTYLLERPGQVITTNAIASLVHQAWHSSFTAVNILSGFRKCGIHPLNPGEVSDRQLAPSMAVRSQNDQPSVSSTSMLVPQSDSSLNASPDSQAPRSQSSTDSSPIFTEEQMKLFEKRFEEGYDLQDDEYSAWVRIYHSEKASPSPSVVSSGSMKSSLDVVKEILTLPKPKPSSQTRKGRKAVNTTAICITDEDILEEMKQKKEEKEAAEEEKELRKIEREKKKEEREKKKQERAKEKERKAKEKERKAKEKEQKAKGRCTRSTKHTDVAEAVGGLNLDEDDEDEDDVACPSCGLDYKDDDSDRDWICCDSCNQWFCFDCSGKTEIPLESEPYYCCNCVY